MNKEAMVEDLLKLPPQFKGVLVGVVLSFLALFLPWYSETDSFANSFNYTALNGPTALIGLTLLMVNIATLTYLVFYAKNSKKKHEVLKAPLLEKWHGVIFLYLSFVLISIYFHNDFGQVGSEKSLKFGFYLGLAGSVISFFFGIIQFQAERQKSHASYLKKGFESDDSLPVSFDDEDLEIPQIRERLNRFSDDNPVYKQQIQKQKQIEEKIKNKLSPQK